MLDKTETVATPARVVASARPGNRRMVNRGHKFRASLTSKQIADSEQLFGCARAVYNWGLNYHKNILRGTTHVHSLAKDKTSGRKQGGIFMTFYTLDKILTRLKQAPEWSFLAKAPASVLTQSLANLYRGFDNFYAGRARHPRYKSKRNRAQSFRIRLSAVNYEKAFDYDAGTITVPFIGTIKLSGVRPIRGKIKMVTVSRDAIGHYYASMAAEVPQDVLAPSDNVIGLDSGLKDVVVDSNGNHYPAPKYFKRLLLELRRAQRRLSRRQKGSNRRERARVRAAKIHARIAYLRSDYIHKLSIQLINDNQVIIIEDLGIAGMMRRGFKLGKSFSDAALSELHRQLAYKAEMYGRRVVEVPRNYPSSKTCSKCGYKLESLPLSVRHWDCPECGTKQDRDENAARNILRKGLEILEQDSNIMAADAAAMRKHKDVERIVSHGV